MSSNPTFLDLGIQLLHMYLDALMFDLVKLSRDSSLLHILQVKWVLCALRITGLSGGSPSFSRFAFRLSWSIFDLHDLQM